MRQIAFERGLHKPDDGKKKMNGKKLDEDDADQDPSYSLPHVLSSCWDFAHAPTALQELVESRGHILRMSVKAHPELTGVGIDARQQRLYVCDAARSTVYALCVH